MSVQFDTSKVVGNIRRLPDLIQNAVWDAAFNIMELTSTRATERLQSGMKYSNGELARSLKYEVVVDDKGNIVGRVWSDNAVAIYRELGTGRHGQESDKDIPSGFQPVYRQTPWFIPVEMVDIDLNKIYGMRKLTIKGKEFYVTSGQPARQFLVPALRDTAEKDAKRILEKTIHESVKGGMVL